MTTKWPVRKDHVIWSAKDMLSFRKIEFVAWLLDNSKFLGFYSLTLIAFSNFNWSCFVGVFWGWSYYCYYYYSFYYLFCGGRWIQCEILINKMFKTWFSSMHQKETLWKGYAEFKGKGWVTPFLQQVCFTISLENMTC